MTAFSISKKLLSHQRKTARPRENCYEHAFLQESILNDARRQLPPLCLAWLDIRNVFRSVPYAVLLTTLTHMDFPPDLITKIRNVYTGATTEVVTPLGRNQPIPIYFGVKRGCPLSATLFNLAVELITRNCVAKAASLPRNPLKHHGCPVSIPAYADDLVIFARNKESLQSLLGTITSTADCLSLQFRPDKCASLCLGKTTPRYQNNVFKVHRQNIPALQREDHYHYLESRLD